jgi:YcxB-like protein
MEKEFIIKQSLSEETLQRASTRILFRSRIVIYLVAVLFMFSANVVMAYQDSAVDLSTFIPFLIIVLAFAAVWYSTRKAISKSYKKNPRYFTDITMTLTPDTIKLEGLDYQNTVEWESYAKIKETKEWFMIFINKQQAHVIDKAQLKGFTVDDLREFFRSLPPKIKVSLK